MPVTRSQSNQQMENISVSPTSAGVSPTPMDITFDISDTIHEETSREYDAQVMSWDYEGYAYLKDSEGFLYDTITGENIGYFDGEKIMDMVEDGIWVEHSTHTEIIPKEELDKNYSDLDLLKIRVKQLEKELLNKDTHIQQQENIRQELIKSRDHWVDIYDETHGKYLELLDMEQLNEIGVDTVATVLEKSGAFENDTSTEQLKQEVTRKEQVIVRKDAKATRLINIIREKNVEIGGLKTSLVSYQNYCGMLSTNVSNLSDRVVEWQNYYNQNTGLGNIPTSGELQSVNQHTSIINETNSVC